MIDRRRFLRGSGAVLVLVAGGGVWRAYDRGVIGAHRGVAYEPWTTWRSDEKEGPLALVRAAILAANAANIQPWLFRVTDSAIDLYVDPSRHLGAFDPFLRELHISIGCALENLLIAAGATGYRAALTLMPGALQPVSSSPRPELVARVTLTTASPDRNELFDAIPHRHTNRTPFDATRPVPASFVDELRQRAGDDERVKLFLFTRDADLAKIVQSVAAAGKIIGAHAEIQAGARRSFHTELRELQTTHDGLTFGDFGESFTESAIEKLFPPKIARMLTPRPTLAAYENVMRTARLFGLIAVRDRYDRADNLRAGRLWQRAHLLATARGLAGRPANQSVELIDHERVWGKEPAEANALAELTGDPSWQPTFMFFMGYATGDAAITPRRGVNEVVLTHDV